MSDPKERFGDVPGLYLGELPPELLPGGAPAADPARFANPDWHKRHRNPDGTFGPLTDAEIDALSSRALEAGVKELPDAKLDELIEAAKKEKRRREQDPLEYD